MSNEITRRGFVGRSLATAAGAAAVLSLEEKALLAAQPETAGKPPPKPADPLPTGKIGKLDLSRLILGGNLIGGWAHSRDLLYVSSLLKHYFTPEKILDTLELAERHGINCVNTHPDATAIINRYWKERGGKIKWMVQAFPDEKDNFDSIKKLIDAGADAAYIQGNVGDELAKAGKTDFIGKALEFIKISQIPAGIAGHSLQVPVACEKAGLPVDFYVKTLHKNNYFSYQKPAPGRDLGQNDNLWCANAEETIAFMKTVAKPWIAYKVMAAGAIPPEHAFPFAFDSGADFVLAGIFDFQIEEDVTCARKALAAVTRERPWRA